MIVSLRETMIVSLWMTMVRKIKEGLQSSAFFFRACMVTFAPTNKQKRTLKKSQAKGDNLVLFLFLLCKNDNKIVTDALQKVIMLH